MISKTQSLTLRSSKQVGEKEKYKPSLKYSKTSFKNNCIQVDVCYFGDLGSEVIDYMRLEDDREFVRWPQNVPCRQRMPAQGKSRARRGWMVLHGVGCSDGARPGR